MLCWLVATLIYVVPSLGAAIPDISGYITQVDGDTITAAEFNTFVGGVYTYINTNITAALNKLTTKGDIFGHDGSDLKRLAVGTNGQVLTADSAATLGIKWASVASVTNLTTKGDLLVYDTGLNRLAVGTDGQVLTADSTATPGVKWATAAASVPTGVIALWSGSIATIPSGWALCDGTGGRPNLQGLFVVGAGNVSPAATGGMGLISPGGPSGDNSAGTGLGPSHTHVPVLQQLAAAGSLGCTSSASNAIGSATITPKYYALAYIQKL